MLSAVPSSLPPLLSVAVDADGPQAVCRSRKKKPPVAGTAAGAAPTSAAGGAAAKPAAGGAAAKPPAGTSKPKGSTSKSTAPRPSASGYARATSPSRTSGSAAAKKGGPLAFLDDPKLSMEEKLLRLLGYLNTKWNKELDQKMKEFKQTGATTSSSSSGSGGGSSGVGGLFKKAVGFATSAVPQLGVALSALSDPTVRSVVKSVAGPALAAAATAAGQPQLAPLALKFGPDLVDGAASLASGAGDGGAPAKARTTTTTKESADGLGSDKDAQLKLMEMQRILDQQKEMFSLVSNLLRTTHDTRMAVIQNVR